jgi:hypothetical protein
VWLPVVNFDIVDIFDSNAPPNTPSQSSLVVGPPGFEPGTRRL